MGWEGGFHRVQVSTTVLVRRVWKRLDVEDTTHQGACPPAAEPLRACWYLKDVVKLWISKGSAAVVDALFCGWERRPSG